MSPETDEVAETQDRAYYCPGCGARSDYQRQCVGTATAPHPAIEVVSTDELNGDPSGFTAAPDTT